jgi:hypothetical protein
VKNPQCESKKSRVVQINQNSTIIKSIHLTKNIHQKATVDCNPVIHVSLLSSPVFNFGFNTAISAFHVVIWLEPDGLLYMVHFVVWEIIWWRWYMRVKFPSQTPSEFEIRGAITWWRFHLRLVWTCIGYKKWVAGVYIVSKRSVAERVPGLHDKTDRNRYVFY